MMNLRTTTPADIIAAKRQDAAAKAARARARLTSIAKAAHAAHDNVDRELKRDVIDDATIDALRILASTAMHAIESAVAARKAEDAAERARRI